MSQFRDDLEKAKPAEGIAFNLFANLGTDYQFEDISESKEYYHKGDIKATSLATGQEYFIDVKDDSVIGASRNVLCEEENFWYESGTYTDGFMYYDYDYLAIVSQPERKVYVIDFKILKSIYRSGEVKVKRHRDNDCIFYALPLYVVKRHKALLYELEY